MGKRVMILSASTGNGHVKAAEAVLEACEADPRIGECCHLDALDYTNPLFQQIYSKGYLEAVKTAPELWAIAYDNLDKPWVGGKALSMIQKLNSQPLVRKIIDWKPDVCIATHFMPADIVSALIQQDRVHCNLGIVVTDYYVHATWLEELFTRYFVAKEENKVHLGQLGLPSDRIVVAGIPTKASFAGPHDADGLKARYGFDPGKPLVVISAGAFGLMSGKVIYRILEQIKTPCQIAVVCGRNEKLKAELEALTADSGSGRSYRIVGYTDAMHEYLGMADVFVGKPGGLSTSECLVAGVPMVIWDPIPGQETYNANHVIEGGAGVIPDNAASIAFKVDQIISNPERRKRMRKAALSLGRPDSAKLIVDSMLRSDDESPVRPFKKTL